MSDKPTPPSGTGVRPAPARPASTATEHELVATLFALGREVTSVLDHSELLQKIPQLIARLTPFQAFAVYLLDESQTALRVAYSEGYPGDVAKTLRLKVGEGLVGAAVAEGRPILVNDVRDDPRYVEAVPGSAAELVVPLRRKGRVIGALNLLSAVPGQFTIVDEAILRQFGAHVAVALENAKLFEQQKRHVATLEVLAEISREIASILDLDEVLAQIAKLTRRIIDYRTLGILLLNEERGELEMKLAVRYGDRVDIPRVKVGQGIVGNAALHREILNVPDVSQDPRYLKIVGDARSELAIPMLLKDRCIGVFDLESPELDAFSQADVEILTLLANQAAVAIENARLYETIRANEVRLENELRFAQRVQAAFLPAGPPKRMKGVESRGPVHAGSGAGRRPLRLPVARREQPGRGGGRRVGQGRAGGAVRRLRRRAPPLAHVPPAVRPGAVHGGRHPGVDEHHPPRAPARGVLLHPVLRHLRLQAPVGGDGQFGAALPDPVRGRDVRAGRDAGRAARRVRRIDLRRSVVRPVAG